MFFSYFLVPISFLVLTERMMNLYSPTLAVTDMDVDKTPADEEADDAITSKPVSLPTLKFVWSTGILVSCLYGSLCLLQLHETLLCSQTTKRKYR